MPFYGHRCCFPGCTTLRKTGDTGVSLFKIPDDPKRRQQWINRMKIDSEKITNLSRVCSNHFEDWCFTSTFRTRISSFAIPCCEAPLLSTPSVTLAQQQQSRSQLNNNAHKDHDYTLALKKTALAIELSSTSKSMSPPKLATIVVEPCENNGSIPGTINSDMPTKELQNGMVILELPPQLQPLKDVSQNHPIMMCVPYPGKENISTPLNEQNAKAMQKGNTELMERMKQKTLQLRNLQSQLSRHRKQLGRLRDEIQKLRLGKKSQDVVNGAAQFIGGYALAFFATQFRVSRGVGCHWPEEMKYFCLCLHKLSPKAYRFLARIFYLPGKTTLRLWAKKEKERCKMDEYMTKFLTSTPFKDVRTAVEHCGEFVVKSCKMDGAVSQKAVEEETHSDDDENDKAPNERMRNNDPSTPESPCKNVSLPIETFSNPHSPSIVRYLNRTSKSAGKRPRSVSIINVPLTVQNSDPHFPTITRTLNRTSKVTKKTLTNVRNLSASNKQRKLLPKPSQGTLHSAQTGFILDGTSFLMFNSNFSNHSVNLSDCDNSRAAKRLKP